MIRLKFRGIISLLLTACMLFLLSMPAMAAGEGYSDMIRVYTLSGINGKKNVIGIAYMYGKTSNKAADNYVAVLKINDNSNQGLMDVMNGDDFNQLVQTCISSTQIDVNNFNELMLSYGAPDEYLMLDEKPFVVSELEKAIAKNKTAVTIKDSTAAFPDAFKMAAAKGITSINFDSLVNKSVSVRITVNPANTTKGIATLANAISSEDDSTFQRIKKYYTNKFTLVDFLQEGSFGTTVKVSAKANLSGLNTNKLEFYYYDYFKNSFSTIKDPKYYIDEKGFLHFETALGGTIVITDKPLTKR